MIVVAVGHKLSHHRFIVIPIRNGSGRIVQPDRSSVMTTNTLFTLIARQQEGLKNLREDAHDIAATIADQVWEKFEIDIEETTEERFMFDLASAIQMALALALASYFEAALEREVLSRFTTWAKELACAAEEEAIDTWRIDVARMCKWVKVRRHAYELIGQSMERAKPGVGRMLGVVVGYFFRDSMQHLDALDEGMIMGAARVRKELLSLHSPLCEKMVEESFAVIQLARLTYATQLDERQRRAEKAETHDNLCVV